MVLLILIFRFADPYLFDVSEGDSDEVALVPDVVGVDIEEIASVGAYGKVIVVAFVEDEVHLAFEYALIDGENDKDEDVELMIRKLSGMLCHVNLIPVNPVRERTLKRPDPERVSEFQKCLEKYGINATIRRELGADIDGACGQLRAKALGEEKRGEAD